jgi:phosphoglycolate phosphatase
MRGSIHMTAHVGRTRVAVGHIRGVLLDKDGTILDFARTWVPINREAAMLAAEGDTCLADELLALGGQDPMTGRIVPGSVLAAGTHIEVASVFARRLGTLAPLDLADSIERCFREGGARHAVAIPGVADALTRLADAGLVLGIATNDSAGGLETSLSAIGLSKRFAFTVGCDEGHGAKPGPGMVHAYCSATGLEPRDVAVVGDAVHDLEMGRRAGCGLLVGVLSGTSGADALREHADVILNSVGDLPDYLLR